MSDKASVFSDEDVKRLREWSENKWAMTRGGLHQDQAKALLARLEAAEKIVAEINFLNGDKRCFAWDMLLEDWRKAAGKQ